MSATDGFRTVVGRGNAGSKRMLIIYGLEEGETYYWSVQAIDHSYIGSAFAPEETFMINTYRKDPDIAGLEVYPNPSNTYINIHLPPELQVNSDISFYDLSGRQIPVNLNSNSCTNEILCYDLENLPPGVYFIILKSKKGIHEERLIKY